MAADVTETETFQLPPATVFDEVVDFSHLAEWDPLFDSSRRVDDTASTATADDHVGLGTRFEVVASIAGTTVPVTYTIEEYDRPHRARLVGRGDGFRSIDEIEVTPHEDGSKLRWHATVETDAPVLDTLATPVFKAVAKASMSGLRDRLGR